MVSFLTRNLRRLGGQTYDIPLSTIDSEESLGSRNQEVVHGLSLDLSKNKFRRIDLQLLCITLICLSAGFSVAAIACGLWIAYHLQKLPDFMVNTWIVRNFLEQPTDGRQRWDRNHYILSCDLAVYWVVLVAFTAAITAFLDAHGRVKSTALLWWLKNEGRGRLTHNSNSHLFRGTKTFGPCHWSMNIVDILTIALSYGSAACVLSSIRVLGSIDDAGEYHDGQIPGAAYGIDVSGYPLIMLGGSLLVQSMMSSWILARILVLHPDTVKSFSSNPVVNALYIKQWPSEDHGIEAQAISSNVTTVRHSARVQVRRVRVLVRVVWCGAAGLLLSCVVASNFAAQGGTFRASTYGDDVWELFGQVETPVGWGSVVTDWAGPLIQFGMQGYLAVLMHCADTVVNVLNDEENWQYSMSGLDKARNAWSPRKYWIRWRSVLLFVAKSSVQWIFGIAVFVDVWFWVSFIPLAVATTLVLLIAIFLEVMTRIKPRGREPSTYGEFALMTKHMATLTQVRL